MSDRQPFTEWTLPADKTPADGDVCEVVMHTVRTSDGIQYDVSLGLRSLSAHAFEQGEDQRAVWSYFVPFGQTDATVAGGSAFVAAARRQQEVADRWARAIS